MINYVFIVLATVCFTAQIASTKVFQRSVRQTIATTLAMLALMGAFGVVYILCVGGFKLDFTLFGVIMAFCFGVVLIPYNMIGIKVLSLGPFAIYSMFLMLGGMAVPFFYGIIFLHEAVSVGKIAGSVLLVFFMTLQAFSHPKQSEEEESNEKSVSRGGKALFFVLCIAIFFINGCTSVISKTHQISASAMSEISFMFCACVVTMLLASVLLAVITLKKGRLSVKEEVKPVFKLKPLLAVFGVSAANYTGNLLQLFAASKVPASVQFPLVSGGVIVLSALVSAFVFKEKLSKKEWISIAGAFVATFLFAF